MHEMQTNAIAVDDPVAWTYVSLSVCRCVCQVCDCSGSFARWHYDAAVTALHAPQPPRPHLITDDGLE